MRTSFQESVCVGRGPQQEGKRHRPSLSPFYTIRPPEGLKPQNPVRPSTRQRNSEHFQTLLLWAGAKHVDLARRGGLGEVVPGSEVPASGFKASGRKVSGSGT